MLFKRRNRTLASDSRAGLNRPIWCTIIHSSTLSTKNINPHIQRVNMMTTIAFVCLLSTWAACPPGVTSQLNQVIPTRRRVENAAKLNQESLMEEEEMLSSRRIGRPVN